MLSEYPILFDGQAIPWPNPDTWREEPQNVETVGTTEAGTDQVITVRKDKFQASGTWNCSSLWAARFREYALKDCVSVSIFDVLTGEYRVIPCRLRSCQASLVGHSQRSAGTQGLYVVSFTLIGFE